jgi:hypothetical protein
MKAKEKAVELVNKYLSGITLNPFSAHVQAIDCALIAVDEIEKALTEYGEDSNELQNMDSEFRWWEEVKLELNKCR